MSVSDPDDSGTGLHSLKRPSKPSMSKRPRPLKHRHSSPATFLRWIRQKKKSENPANFSETAAASLEEMTSSANTQGNLRHSGNSVDGVQVSVAMTTDDVDGLRHGKTNIFGALKRRFSKRWERRRKTSLLRSYGLDEPSLESGSQDSVLRWADIESDPGTELAVCHRRRSSGSSHDSSARSEYSGSVSRKSSSDCGKNTQVVSWKDDSMIHSTERRKSGSDALDLRQDDPIQMRQLISQLSTTSQGTCMCFKFGGQRRHSSEKSRKSVDIGAAYGDDHLDAMSEHSNSSVAQEPEGWDIPEGYVENGDRANEALLHTVDQQILSQPHNIVRETIPEDSNRNMFFVGVSNGPELEHTGSDTNSDGPVLDSERTLECPNSVKSKRHSLKKQDEIDVHRGLPKGMSEPWDLCFMAERPKINERAFSEPTEQRRKTLGPATFHVHGNVMAERPGFLAVLPEGSTNSLAAAAESSKPQQDDITAKDNPKPKKMDRKGSFRRLPFKFPKPGKCSSHSQQKEQQKRQITSEVSSTQYTRTQYLFVCLSLLLVVFVCDM